MNYQGYYPSNTDICGHPSSFARLQEKLNPKPLNEVDIDDPKVVKDLLNQYLAVYKRANYKLCFCEACNLLESKFLIKDHIMYKTYEHFHKLYLRKILSNFRLTKVDGVFQNQKLEPLKNPKPNLKFCK